MRALRADNADGVVYLGSFSKTLAPGFRVGWALAPHAIRDKLVLAMESAVLSHSTFTQLAVGEYLATQPWREQIKTFQELYRERRDAMLGALEALMPRRSHLDATRRRVLRLGARCPRASTPRPSCRGRSRSASRSSPAPGSTPTAAGHGTCGCRTAIREPDRIREGVRRLAGVIEQEIQLRDTFGTGSTRGHVGVDTPGPDLA